ncbi:hypothetical protein K2X33_06420 [bacterium]|nr:hypothetical protein [bacterium]
METQFLELWKKQKAVAPDQWEKIEPRIEHHGGIFGIYKKDTQQPSFHFPSLARPETGKVSPEIESLLSEFLPPDFAYQGVHLDYLIRNMGYLTNPADTLGKLLKTRIDRNKAKERLGIGFWLQEIKEKDSKVFRAMVGRYGQSFLPDLEREMDAESEKLKAGGLSQAEISNTKSIHADIYKVE